MKRQAEGGEGCRMEGGEREGGGVNLIFSFIYAPDFFFMPPWFSLIFNGPTEVICIQ